MAYQATFQRYELKFMLTKDQYEILVAAISPYMAPDHYGRTNIRNLYYDTNSWRLIRHSMEKPVYKEKLRLRSYGIDRKPIYVELKKKYRATVYKRRLSMPEEMAVEWLAGGNCPQDSQIGKEIHYFRDFYQTLRPRVFLSYDRIAWYAKDGSDLRVTFDESIQYRTEDLTLNANSPCIPIMGEDQVLMEIKTSGGIPLWLTQVLSQHKIYKTSFSKYGTAYQNMIHSGGFVYVPKLI